MKKIIMLICLLFIGCGVIIDSVPMKIISIEKASGEGYCLYAVADKPVHIKIVDVCGKYNIGDNLIIIKQEIKK